MSELRAAMVGFEITPRFHPQFGAWGTSPTQPELDLPLYARCLAVEQDGRKLLWYGSDLVGFPIDECNGLRDEIAGQVGMEREQVIFSTSQTHSSGAFPGSDVTGSGLIDGSENDAAYAAEERKRVMQLYFDAGREALESVQPVNLFAGRGHCDNMSYNTRYPMAGGAIKFSRHHSEGLQSGKFFDPTIGLLRFEDKHGRPLGVVFNFCCHPATMIMDKWVSPDWVGTARRYIEEASGGAPAMFIQGFCGDVNCYHIFGSADNARQNGEKLGKAAAEAMGTLIPARTEPFNFDWQTVELPTRPMWTAAELDVEIAGREAFVEQLQRDPQATWFCGVNFPEQMTVEQRLKGVGFQLAYFYEARKRLAANDVPPPLEITLGAVRIGDVGAAVSPGENFTYTGDRVRRTSPFVHTLVCGDSNGLFGYIGGDRDIDQRGYETFSFWATMNMGGFQLCPAKGTADTIVHSLTGLLRQL